MGFPTYRYHADKAPKGMIFDSDHLPAEADGWFDSPKKFNGIVVTDGPLDTDAASGEFPDPAPFADVHAFIAAVNPMIPVVPTPEEAAANQIPDKDVEALAAAAMAMRLRALAFYAKRRHGVEFPADVTLVQAGKECQKLDKAKAK